MARTDRAKRVDPHQADDYAEVGRRLVHAGRSILEHSDSRHASALAILAIHATIAFSDAVCIHVGGKKSTSADHVAVLALLRDILGSRLTAAHERTLQRVLGETDRFEYQGHVATMADAQRLFERAESVAVWAETTLTGTRRAGG